MKKRPYFGVTSDPGGGGFSTDTLVGDWGTGCLGGGTTI